MHACNESSKYEFVEMIVCKMRLIHLILFIYSLDGVLWAMLHQHQYDVSAQVSWIESYGNCMGEQLEICWNYTSKKPGNSTHM